MRGSLTQSMRDALFHAGIKNNFLLNSQHIWRVENHEIVMNIHQSTVSYEKWVSSCIPVDRHALIFKHKQMAIGLFPFLRATFYRWAQIWREEAGDAATAPAVLAVGDLHLENFGTWRDTEGRLIWGINDFDEAANIHFGSPRAIHAIKRDLVKRPGNWLHKAAKAMLRATQRDWRAWRK
jgi:hypothetical protein